MITVNIVEGRNPLICVDAEMYLVPNKSCKLNNFVRILQDIQRPHMQEICILNGKEFNESDDILVEVCIASDNIDSENIIENCGIDFKTEINGKLYVVRGLFDNFYYLPKKLVDIKEGEYTDIIVSAIAIDPITMETINVDIKFHTLAAQHKYRYSYAAYEDVMKEVCKGEF